MKFSVLPDSKNTEPFSTRFALKRNNWDDYNFKISYELFRRADGRDKEPDLIGNLKVLFAGGEEANQMVISEKFDALPDDAYSVSDSLDFYERVSALSDSEKDWLMESLNDLVAHPALRDEASELEGYSDALFRGIDDIEGFCVDAGAILQSDFSQLPDLGEPFEFQVAGWEDSIEFSFDAPEAAPSIWKSTGVRAGRTRVVLPRRIAVVIGRNGCGKSTLLSRLARVAFAKPSDRKSDQFKALGEISPPQFGFTRIITVSYSAFDSFHIPGVNESERLQISKDIKNGEGRFIFCGLRDIAAELEDDREDASADRRTTTRLKALIDLAREFQHLLSVIIRKERQEYFEEGLKVILADASFSEFEQHSLSGLVGNDPVGAFMGWSTGHKIAIHVLASIAAHCQRKSIVLFDEPEMHLHPPLIAALMRAIRIVLEKTNAFGIVATHSPVVLQETMAQHVYVIERNGHVVTVRQPEMETFAESIGSLTYDSFGLNAEATYFHEVLKALVDSARGQSELEKLFPLGLSAQAEALAMSLFARRDRDGGG